MEVKPKRYTYRTSVTWAGEKRGVINATGKPAVQVATPPEFKGHAGIWSPEDLFVAAVNVCIMSTFLAFAERAGLLFTTYASEAEGHLELVDGKFQFTTVVVKPTITINTGGDAERTKELLVKAESSCLVSNSVKAKVILEPTIDVA